MILEQNKYKLRAKDRELTILRACYELFDDTVKSILDCSDDSIEINIIGRFDQRRFGDYSGICLNEWLRPVRSLRANGMKYTYVLCWWGNIFCFADDVDIFKHFNCCDLDIRVIRSIEILSPFSANTIRPSLIELFNVGV